MVVTFAPLTVPTVVTHERIALPLTCTVHAPHCETPQPYFVPVSFSSSRITQRSGVLSSDWADTGLPLRVNRTIGPPPWELKLCAELCCKIEKIGGDDVEVAALVGTAAPLRAVLERPRHVRGFQAGGLRRAQIGRMGGDHHYFGALVAEQARRHLVDLGIGLVFLDQFAREHAIPRQAGVLGHLDQQAEVAV